MAHFCETFNRPEDEILVVGFDELWFASSGGFQIANQRSQPHTCNFANSAFRVAPLDTSDLVGSLDIIRLDPVPELGMGFGLNAVSIQLRVTSQITPRDYYAVQYVWYIGYAARYAVQIIKQVANVQTNLAIVPRPFTPGDRLKARVVGDTIQALVNDELIAEVTDASHITPKIIGFEYFVDCATWTPPGGFPGIITDNFFGGDVAEEDFL